MPRQDELKLDPDAAYVHYTTNNTIFGTEFDYVPDTADGAARGRRVLGHFQRSD